MTNNNAGSTRGEKGGEVAANRTVSAASVAKTLSGLDFPKNKQDIVNYAEQNKEKVEDSDAVINTIKQIPDREYNGMADVEHEVGKLK